MRTVRQSFWLVALGYFTARGLLIAEFNFGGVPDVILSGIVRAIGLASLTFFLLRNGSSLSSERRLIAWMLCLMLISALLNQSSLLQTAVFVSLVFYPIGLCLMIAGKSTIVQTRRICAMFLLLGLVQYGYSVVSNLDAVLARLVVDDPFNGFFGYPRAYHFSFFAISAATLTVCSLEDTSRRRKRWLFLSSLLLMSTPVLAGAGRLVFSLVVAVVLASLLVGGGAKRKIAMACVAAALTLAFPYYASVYQVTADVFAELISSPFDNLKWLYFLDSFSPILQDLVSFLLGFGPGQYMSSAAQQFRPDLVYKYNESLHLTHDSDVFQAFNNIVGFAGDGGVVFFILYYWLVLAISLKILRGLSGFRAYVFTVYVVFTLLLSCLFQVFDDPYFSCSFWLAVGCLLRITQRKNQNEDKRYHTIVQSRTFHSEMPRVCESSIRRV